MLRSSVVFGRAARRRVRLAVPLARALGGFGVAWLVACGGAAPPAGTPAPTGKSAALDTTTPASLAAAQEIAALHTRWREALSKRDTAFFAGVLMNNFQITGGEATLSKEQFMQAVVADTGGVAPSRFEETSIRLYGDVAVATGLIRYDIPGETEPALTRYSEVWVKEGKQWRAAHLHYNPVPPANRVTPPPPTPPSGSRESR
jgi:ketosteroid isomerase-like protein